MRDIIVILIVLCCVFGYKPVKNMVGAKHDQHYAATRGLTAYSHVFATNDICSVMYAPIKAIEVGFQKELDDVSLPSGLFDDDFWQIENAMNNIARKAELYDLDKGDLYADMAGSYESAGAIAKFMAWCEVNPFNGVVHDVIKFVPKIYSTGHVVWCRANMFWLHGKEYWKWKRVGE